MPEFQYLDKIFTCNRQLRHFDIAEKVTHHCAAPIEHYGVRYAGEYLGLKDIAEI